MIKKNLSISGFFNYMYGVAAPPLRGFAPAIVTVTEYVARVTLVAHLAMFPFV